MPYCTIDLGQHWTRYCTNVDFISKLLYHSPESNTLTHSEFKNHTFKITATFSRDQWVEHRALRPHVMIVCWKRNIGGWLCHYLSQLKCCLSSLLPEGSREVEHQRDAQCVPQHNLAVQWRHNQCDGVSNHQPHNCLPKRLFRHRSKKALKLCVIDLCAENSLVSGKFPAHRASDAENVSIWWRHHELVMSSRSV